MYKPQISAHSYQNSRKITGNLLYRIREHFDAQIRKILYLTVYCAKIQLNVIFSHLS